MSRFVILIKKILLVSILFYISSIHSQSDEVLEELKNRHPADQILWGKDDDVDSSLFLNGSILMNENDFVITRGRMWQGTPPKSIGTFSYGNEIIDNSGAFNNQAVILLESGKSEDRKKAKGMLIAGIKFDPLFFPFRYNLGRVYQIELLYEKSIIEFEFAKSIIPNFYKTYIHLFSLLINTKEKFYAIQCLEKAIQSNQFDSEALILLADYYLEQGLKNRARIYLDDALKIDEDNPNARLGLARVELESNHQYKAFLILKNTDLFELDGSRKRYNMKFHYYFAEVASFLKDYITAELQYEELLKRPNDPIFSFVPYKVIVRKKEIMSKFREILENESKL